MALVQPPAFASLLRQFRLAAGLTQEELADRARLSTRAVSDLERGVRRTPYRDTVQSLANALELGADDRILFEAAARRTGDAPLQAPTVGILAPTGAFLGAMPVGGLIGRDEEMARIQRAIEAVEAGSGRVVLLTGEPGIGKTRVAQEVSVELRDRSFLVAVGRCYEQQQAVPFYPFLDALAVLYTAAPPDVRAALPERWPQLARLLPDQGLPMPAQASSEEEEREWLFRAVSSFVVTLAERAPVALLLDALHWADHASLGLLQHLARHTRGHRVLVVGTYQDVGGAREQRVRWQHPLRQAVRLLDREGLIEQVPLPRLSQEGTAALIAALLGDHDVPQDLAAFVHRHTEGNPFFTQELLRALVEGDHVCHQDGRWSCGDLSRLEVPESVRDAIGAHLASLDPETQDVLFEASVLGQTFQFDDLQGMGSRREEDIEEALEEGAAAGLVRMTDKDRYAFNHALTQQTLYTELPPRRRRRLHLAAGEVLEQLADGAKESRLAELAWHFREGEEPERALSYTLLAGDQAEAVFAHWEAERQYRSALELARTIEDRDREAESLQKLGNVLHRQARYERARTSYERALALTPPEERLRRADLHRKISRTWAAWSTNDRPDEALHALDLAESALGEEPPDGDVAWRRAWVDIQLDRMQVYHKLGQAQKIAELLERTRPVVEQLGTARQWAWFFRSLSNAALRRDRYAVSEEALGYARQYLQAAEELGDAHHVAHAQYHLGFCYLWHGDLDEAEELLQTALRTAQQAGDVRDQARCLIYLTMVRRKRGQVDAVRGYTARSRSAASEADMPGYLAMADAHLAWIAWREGDLAEGEAKGQAALDRWRRNQADYTMFHWMAVWPLLGIALVQEKIPDAIDHARTLLDPSMQPLPEKLAKTLAKAVRSWTRGQTQAARSHLEEAARLAQDMGYL